MASVALVTDSTAHLPQQLVERYRITVVPLYVRFGEQVFRDGVDITTEQFYARLRTTPVMPATSQPSAGDFIEVYRRLIEAGASAIVSIHISSKLSGTVASATMARDELGGEVPIYIVDSLSTSMGQGYQVLQAARDLEAGRSPEEVVHALEDVRERIRILFVVDTLEFLHRGGRIGGAAAFLGSLLNLKPLLSLHDGIVDAVERVRTKRRAVQRMLEILTSELGDRPIRAGILQAAVPEEGAELHREVEARLNCREIHDAELSPVIGTHTGPGTVGVVAYPVLGE